MCCVNLFLLLSFSHDGYVGVSSLHQDFGAHLTSHPLKCLVQWFLCCSLCRTWSTFTVCSRPEFAHWDPVDHLFVEIWLIICSLGPCWPPRCSWNTFTVCALLLYCDDPEELAMKSFIALRWPVMTSSSCISFRTVCRRWVQSMWLVEGRFPEFLWVSQSWVLGSHGYEFWCSSLRWRFAIFSCTLSLCNRLCACSSDVRAVFWCAPVCFGFASAIGWCSGVLFVVCVICMHSCFVCSRGSGKKWKSFVLLLLAR